MDGLQETLLASTCRSINPFILSCISSRNGVRALAAVGLREILALLEWAGGILFRHSVREENNLYHHIRRPPLIFLFCFFFPFVCFFVLEESVTFISTQ